MNNENELQTWLKGMKRVPWSAGKPFIKTAGIDPSSGWSQTIARLSSWDLAGKKYNVALSSVKQLFQMHLYVGEKLVLWFNVDKDQIAAFHQLLTQLRPQITTTYSSSFPLPVSSEVLSANQEHQPELTAIEDTPDYIAVIYCSKRSFNKREELIPTRFTKEDRTWLAQYQQVVGYKKVEFQAYDVILLNKTTGLLEFRIDAPEGLSQDDSRTCRNAVTEKFYDSLAQAASGTLPPMTELNFFPAIEKMYKAANEGSVFELYFTATTGSNNFGKMRNKEKDLRTEAFHQAGATKVGITPYRLGIMWHQTGRIFHPELHLPGSLKLFALGKVQPLRSAFVRNCITFDDYDLVSRRFLKYL
jgi:hypothetical protein